MTLYKYMSSERIDVLETARIRFTTPDALNDPFEGRPYFEAVEFHHGFQDGVLESDIAAGRPHRVSEEKLREAYEKLSDPRRSSIPYHRFYKLLWTVETDATGTPIPLDVERRVRRHMMALIRFSREVKPQIVDTFTTKVGLLCLSRRRDSETMWSHYADSHRGFVLGFDENHPWFDRRERPDDPFGCVHSINYVDRRPTFGLWQSMTFGDAYCYKGSEWAYEEECRMLAWAESADAILPGHDGTPVYLFAFPSNAVTEVLSGCRMTHVDRERLTRTLEDSRYNHVQLVDVVRDERAGRLDFRASSGPRPPF